MKEFSCIPYLAIFLGIHDIHLQSFVIVKKLNAIWVFLCFIKTRDGIAWGTNFLLCCDNMLLCHWMLFFWILLIELMGLICVLLVQSIEVSGLSKFATSTTCFGAWY